MVAADTTPAPARASDGRAEGVRALFVLNSLSVGGSETKIIRVVNALLRRCVPAGIAYLNPPRELLRSLDPQAPVWHLQRRGKFSMTALGKLRYLIREQRPRVVLSVNMYPALYVTLATAGMSSRPRTIGLLNTTTLAKGEQWRQSFYRPFLRRLDGMVYGCEMQRCAWRGSLHFGQARSTVIYNGVDTQHFAPTESDAQRLAERQRHGIAPQAFVVGAVGRLAPEKNQAVLIHALAELRRCSIDAHLLLVGEGALRAELNRRAAELQMQSHVTFVGMQRDVRPSLSMMDVFVLPSTHIETFSNAALEAMAMEKPVILSRIGGAAEMVTEGVEGFMLAAAELADRLPPLLARLHADRELRSRLGRAARQRVVQRFSLQTMVERYASLIETHPDQAFG